MALLNNYTNIDTGLNITNAYYKARKDCSILSSNVFFSCDVYNSEQDRQNNKSSLASIEYSINSNEAIPSDTDERAKYFYGLLKTLPDFKNSIDC